MYKARFESDNGKTYFFGSDHGTAFDMDAGNGLSVSIGTAQGFAQVGETVQNMKTSGRTITISGVIFKDVPEEKRKMQNAFAPFASGNLIFNDSYSIRVYVKSSPAFSPVRDNGKFSMQLFAPMPFFTSLSGKVYSIGEVTPLFRFPVNYAEPHCFGKITTKRVVNAVNDGDAKAPLDIRIDATGFCSNITISNLETFEFVKLNGEINTGDYIHLWRDDFNVLKAELVSGGEISDIISWIDEESNLFELNVGNNVVAATDDNDGKYMTVTINLNPKAVSVYEN